VLLLDKAGMKHEITPGFYPISAGLNTRSRGNSNKTKFQGMKI